MSATEDVFLAFPDHEIIDETSVQVGMGRPVQSYRLRVVFSAHAYNASAAFGHITLFNSDRLVTTSATYETVIPGRLGRDVIEIGPVRWIALIETRSDAWKGYSVSAASAVDGLLFIGDLSSPAPSNHWRAGRFDRTGITWFRSPTSLYAARHDSPNGDKRQQSTGQLFRPFTSMTALDSSTTAAFNLGSTRLYTVAVMDQVKVKGFDSPRPFRVLLSPDSHGSYIPISLFRWYFRDKNIYTTFSAQWNALELVFANGFRLALDGYSILPVSEGAAPSFGTTTNGGAGGSSTSSNGNDEAFNTQHALRVLVSAVESGWDDLSTLDAMETLISSGFDTLKLMPHHEDNETIILGGHLLWASALLELEYQDGREVLSAVGKKGGEQESIVRLLSNPIGTSLSSWEALIITIVIFLYIRWKLGTLWIDYTVDGKGWIQYYFFIVSLDTIMWPFYLPLWMTLIVAVLYIPSAMNSQPWPIVLHVIITLAVSWVLGLLLSVVMLLSKYRVMSTRYSRKCDSFTRHPWQSINTTIRQAFVTTSDQAMEEKGKRSDPEDPTQQLPEMITRASNPAAGYQQLKARHRPIFSESPSVSTHWGEAPVYEKEYKENYGRFFWYPVSVLAVRDSFLNTLVALSLWLIFAPLDTPIFAVIMSLLVLIVMAYSGLVQFMNLLYLTFWPVCSRHRPYRASARFIPILLLLLALAISINDFYILISASLLPTLLTSSLIYGNSDEAVGVLIALFILATIFIVSRFSHSFVLSLFLPREAIRKRVATFPASKNKHH